MKTAVPGSPDMRTGQGVSPQAFAWPSSLRLARRLKRNLWQFAGLYLLLGLTWFLVGDWMLDHLGADPAHLVQWRLASKVLFLVLTSIAISLLVRALVRNALQSHLRLAVSEASHREMFQANPNPMLVYDVETRRILDANPASASFFGWPRHRFVGMAISELWPSSAVVQLGQLTEDAKAASKQVHVVTAPLRLQDGTLRVVEARSTSLQYGGVAARLLVINDRHAEYQAQKRRDQALQRLEEAQAIAHIGSWELDPATGLGTYSAQVYQMLGRQPPCDDDRHHGFERLLADCGAETLARIKSALQALSDETLARLDLLLPVMTVDGHPRMLHLRAASIQDDGVRCIRGTLQDVTEHETSRRLLSEREEQFRQLVRVLPDGVAIFHQEQIVYANTACEGQLGDAGKRLTGELLQDLVLESDLDMVRDQLEAAHRHGESSFTVHMRRADGSVFRAGLSLADVRYGGLDCKLLLMRDLSEPERMRDALAASNGELHAMARRLFSLQEDERRAISRDLHDDIGQSITAMKLSAHAALNEVESARRSEDLQEIMRLADTSLVRLRNLSMLLRPPQLDALGLEAALRWQANMLFRASTVRLQMDIQPLGIRPSVEVEQACFRIAQEALTNALRHANAGEVHLGLRDDISGHQLCLDVVDDGDGFDPAGPRGLGLIVMRERAQSTGGKLQIDSAPGAGTRITLRLPYSDATLTNMPGQ